MSNIMALMANADKLSVAQLQQSIKDGTLPAYVGIPLLQQKMQMQKQAQVSQAPAQPPVAQQVMQEAQASAPREGIDHLRSNLPTEGMAGGGIIAFEHGGDVPRYDGQGPTQLITPNYSIDQTPTSAFERGIINPVKSFFGDLGDTASQTGSDYWNYATDASKLLAEKNSLQKGVFAQEIPSQRIARQQRINDIDTQLNQLTPSAATSSITALPGAKMGTPVDRSTDMLAANADTGSDVDKQINKTKPQGDPKAGLTSLIPKPATITPQTVQDPSSAFAALDSNPPVTAEDAAARWKAALPDDEGRKAVEDKLAKMEEKTSEQEEQSTWMALMKAGMATMAGTSPYALSNIGKGGEAGLADYEAAQDRVEKARDKQLTIQQQLAQSKRAEDVAASTYGFNSEQADKAQRHTDKLAEINANTNIQMHNATADLEAQKANVSSGLEYGKARAEETYQKGSLANQSQANQIAAQNKIIGQNRELASLYANIDAKARAEVDGQIKATGATVSADDYEKMVQDKIRRYQNDAGLAPRSNPTGWSYEGVLPNSK